MILTASVATVAFSLVSMLVTFSVGGAILAFEEDANPQYLAQLRSYLDVGDDIEFNAVAWLGSDVHVVKVEELLRQAAGGGQVWTMGQLAAWLACCRGVRISRGRLGALLRQRGCCWTSPGRPPAA